MADGRLLRSAAVVPGVAAKAGAGDTMLRRATLLTLAKTHAPATDQGYLPHEDTACAQSFGLSFGQARIFYPEAGKDRCTAALLLAIDPVGLFRDGRESPVEGVSLDQYVNDRPFGGVATTGPSWPTPSCRYTPAWPSSPAAAARPSCDGRSSRSATPGTPTAARSTRPAPTGARAPTSQSSSAAAAACAALPAHLHVLDADNHYWVSGDEVDKLRHGVGCLAAHPERDAIPRRHLKHQPRLARAALARMAEEDCPDPDADAEAAAEERLSLQRAAARRRPARSERGRSAAASARPQLRRGRARPRVAQGPGPTETGGVGVSFRALDVARERLHWDRLPPAHQQRVKLLQGSLTYRARRLTGDHAAVVE